jgi:hypothetical protein
VRSDGAAQAAASDQERPTVKTAAVTFVYNEAFNLPVWIRYFGGQFGTQNLFVVDRGSDDGSTDGLGDVNKITLPHGEFDDQAKTTFINRLQQGLLEYYDTVIYTDADELIVPDPALFTDLRTYLEQKQFDYVSCVGLNVVHILTQEAPLDQTKPLLQQRRFGRFSSAECKPLVSRVPMNWAPGFHCSDKPPLIDPELFQFHTKWVDFNLAMQRQSVNRSTTRSKRNVDRGMGAHWNYDTDRFVREGFFDPINEIAQRGVAQFDFSAEIGAINAGSALASGVHFIPMNITKIVEIPERFRAAF